MGVLLDRKYEKLFSLLDVNGDGVIAEDDFVLMADRVLAAFDGEGTDKGQKYAGEMMNYWRALRESADGDHDGRIDKDEFRQALHRISDDFATLIGPLYRTGFHVADRDGDGRVGRDDFVTVFVAIGVPASEAGAAFDGLIGHEPQLTEDQLMAAVTHFYRDDHPDHASSHLLFGAL